jgi:hypothetical protein
VSLWKRREIREKTMENMVFARQSGGRERVLSKTHSQTEIAQATAEPGECSQPADGTSRELEGLPMVNQWTNAFQTTENGTVGVNVMCSVLKELEMR